MDTKNHIIILGIESSCDETSASVVKDGKVLANLIANQKIHELYGGVVPELASRAHQKNIIPVVDQALRESGIKKEDLTAIAFTRGPGLIGSLLVGASFAKAMALALNIPLIEVNHMRAHVLAHFAQSVNLDFAHSQLLQTPPTSYDLLKEFAETRREKPTDTESILRRELSNKPLAGYKFRQHYLLGTYMADFICLKPPLVIELEGLMHQPPDLNEKNEIITKWLNEQGFTVLRLTNNELIENIEASLNKIKTKLESICNQESSHLPVSNEKADEKETVPAFPFLCLTVSGGHTQIVISKSYLEMEVIGETIDDAAGEAFDKAAKILGLPYPGGPLVDKHAQKGNPHTFKFSEPSIPNLDFSFSGLKTSILYFIRDKVKEDKDFIEKNLNDLCASIQQTIIKILLDKLIIASKKTGINEIAIAGGVSANSGLRNELKVIGKVMGWNTYIPPFEYCTDNAAMIAIAGHYKYLKGDFATQNTVASARYKI